MYFEYFSFIQTIQHENHTYIDILSVNDIIILVCYIYSCIKNMKNCVIKYFDMYNLMCHVNYFYLTKLYKSVM